MNSNTFSSNASSGKKFQISAVLALSAVLFLGMLAYSIYVGLSHSQLQTELKLTKSSVEEVKEQISSLDKKGINIALSAGNILDRLNDKFFKWSVVMQKIQDTVPKNSQKSPKVNFVSYAGGKDGQINVTTRTLSSSIDPYEDTANLLRAFNDSAHFAEAFIPSIAENKGSDASKILNYNFQFKYLGDEETQPVPRKSKEEITN